MRLHKFIKSALLISCTIALLFVCSLPILSTRSQPAPTPSTPRSGVDAQTPNFEQAFQELGVDGSIAIYDKNNQRFYEYNPSRNTTAFFPASTFKILNALISLETGVIQDDVAVLTWDGITREIPAWNRDTNLRQAFKDSTVWFYQVLARKNGHERMQNFVTQTEYGNLRIGAPDRIDRFWLEGPLQITPKQEIEFLQRLERNDLPFSQRAIDLVKDIMVVEKTPNYTLRGKTGWVDDVGWFVGYLEQNNNVYFFATNIVMLNVEAASKRVEVTRQSFQALELF